MALPKGKVDHSCVTEDSKRDLQIGGLVLLIVVVGLLAGEDTIIEELVRLVMCCRWAIEVVHVIALVLSCLM